MYLISKEFTFSAAHQLSHLPETHQCHRLHGHNYIVRVYLAQGYLDDRGFVKDYGELESVQKYLKETLDHRNLNEVWGVKTTAEKIAEELFYIFRHRFGISQLVAVGVSETSKTWAWYSENDNIIFSF
jgi:6-pyruvoyltetrahydropterin/6-carboxytetrahydropterin synthase